MFGFFKKKSKADKLQAHYDLLVEASFKLSHTDRKASSLKALEAETVLKEIEKLRAEEKK